MSSKKSTLEPRVDVKAFGDIHQLAYNVEFDKVEAIGLLGPFDIAHLLEAIGASRANGKRKVDKDIAELAKKLASAVIKGCVTARTFAFVSNGPTVKLTSIEADELLAAKQETKASVKRKAQEIALREKMAKPV